MAPQIFDRAARRASWARALGAPDSDRWLLAHIADEILARLALSKREYAVALVTGPVASETTEALSSLAVGRVIAQGRDVAFDEDRPPFADASFDLIVSAGGLDTLDDLPGALIRIRQMLRPGGVFTGAFAAAGSLPALRTAFAGIAQRSHFHPQIDVRAAGDLLARAGFKIPIADLDTIEARFGRIEDVVRDVRANALSNVMSGRKPLTRHEWRDVRERFDTLGSDGRVVEAFAFVHLSGRVP